MNANAMTPNWAIENGTPVDVAITPVAAAVPGPQITSAAVPMNSAATLREKDTSALEAIVRPNSRPAREGCGPQLLRWGPLETRHRSVKPNNVSPSFRRGDAGVN